MKRLNFIEIDELIEYEPDKFCKVQYNKILKEVNMIKSRTAMMAAHVKRIKGTLSLLPNAKYLYHASIKIRFYEIEFQYLNFSIYV